MTRHYLCLLLGLFVGIIPPVNAAPPSSFSEVKRVAADKIYHDRRITFYCGCEYQKIGKKNVVDLATCGYQTRKNANRANRVEWEHVVPAWHFGHQRRCWQQGSRRDCVSDDPVFRMMEADLHNLVPVIGEINGDRSNYKFGMIEGESREYGQCDFEVDFKAGIAEPTDSIRGDIARTYFYMRDQYGLRISAQQTKLFNAWSKLDPADEWECEKNRRIKAIQGRPNPHVSSGCDAPQNAGRDGGIHGLKQ